MFWPKFIYQTDKNYLAILKWIINLTLVLMHKKLSTRTYRRLINTDKVNPIQYSYKHWKFQDVVDLLSHNTPQN